MSMHKGLSRRLFLGGAAATVALPFFESLTPREARGQAASAPKRFLAYFAPNGFDMADFRPTAGPGPLAHARLDALVGPAHGGGVGQVQFHSAHVRLVGDRLRVQLEDYRVADLLRLTHRLRLAAGHRRRHGRMP